MSYEAIETSFENGVATITLNRPDALNAITRTMLEELADAVKEAGNDDDVRVVVLTGSGRAFSAGVDLKELGDRKLAKGGVGESIDKPARKLIKTIQTSVINK